MASAKDKCQFVVDKGKIMSSTRGNISSSLSKLGEEAGRGSSLLTKFCHFCNFPCKNGEFHTTQILRKKKKKGSRRVLEMETWIPGKEAGGITLRKESF